LVPRLAELICLSVLVLIFYDFWNTCLRKQ
jgi:hypothetical protein